VYVESCLLVDYTGKQQLVSMHGCVALTDYCVKMWLITHTHTTILQPSWILSGTYYCVNKSCIDIFGHFRTCSILTCALCTF